MFTCSQSNSDVYYSKGTTDSQQLHKAQHTVTILSMTLMSEFSGLINHVDGQCAFQQGIFLPEQAYHSFNMNPDPREASS